MYKTGLGKLLFSTNECQKKQGLLCLWIDVSKIA